MPTALHAYRDGRIALGGHGDGVVVGFLEEHHEDEAEVKRTVAAEARRPGRRGHRQPPSTRREDGTSDMKPPVGGGMPAKRTGGRSPWRRPGEQVLPAQAPPPVEGPWPPPTIPAPSARSRTASAATPKAPTQAVGEQVKSDGLDGRPGGRPRLRWYEARMGDRR